MTSADTKTVAFQNIDAVGADLLPAQQFGCGDDGDDEPGRSFVVTLFGRMARASDGSGGGSVAIEVHGVRPSFLVDLTDTSFERELERLFGCLGCRHPRRQRKRFGRRGGYGDGHDDERARIRAAVKRRGEVADIELVRRRRLQGFDHFRERPFAEFFFDTEAARKRFVKKCYERRRGKRVAPIPGAPPTSETDLRPMLAMFQRRGLEACNWMVAEHASEGFRSFQEAAAGIATFSVHARDLRPPTDAEREALPIMAGITTMLFDAEMESSHGDFPLARKTCRRPAQSVVELVGCLSSGDPAELRRCVAGRLRRAFDAGDLDGRLYAKGGRLLPRGFDSLGAFVASPGFRGVVSAICAEFLPPAATDRDDDDAARELDAADRDDDDALEGLDERTWAARVKGWDRELLTDRIDALIRPLVPRGVEGDRVIQIGVVVSEAGNASGPTHRVVFVLGGCASLGDDGATELRTFDTEAALLLDFAAFVLEVDPDVVSGYNIIPFDLPYIFDRAREHGGRVFETVTDLGRLRRSVRGCEGEDPRWSPWPHLLPLTDLRTQKLSSAAMGDNTWRRWDWVGRVQLDQIVVIRNGHNLDSYKLDAVSAHFMFGTIGSATAVVGDDAAAAAAANASDDAAAAAAAAANASDDAAASPCLVRIETDDARGVVSGDYVTLSYMHGAVREQLELDDGGEYTSDVGLFGGAPSASASATAKHKKFRVVSVERPGGGNAGSFTIRAGSERTARHWAARAADCDRWNQAKDDVPPEEIFRLQRGTDEDRARLARYCIKDVLLTVELLAKILAVENNIAYANICGVPLSWVTDRGVGAKLHSFMCGKCRALGYALPRLYPEDPADNAKELPFGFDDDEPPSDELRRAVDAMYVARRGELRSEAVEGAFVLKPEAGIYRQPTAVADYTSLYPSGIISKNMTHEAVVYQPEYQGEEGRRKLEAMGYLVYDVPYDARVYTAVDPDDGRAIKPRSVGRRVARFACRRAEPGSPEDDGHGRALGIVPLILTELLRLRKATKRRMKAASKAGKHFLASVLDGQQLGQKITANSLYGQTGCSTSKMRKKTLASATTAEGRYMLLEAKAVVERQYTPQTPLELPGLGQRVVGARVVYGDTDSIFIQFRVADADTGADVTGGAALEATIRAGEDVEKAAAAEDWLMHPHCLEYEKCFHPFVLISKKKYVGMKYAAGKTTATLSSMGIVLKRRDNPPILKRIYGDVIDGLMKGHDFTRIVEAVQTQITSLLQRPPHAPLHDLVISKRLRSGYKRPNQIAHYVLAKRMEARQQGSGPKCNERVHYVFTKREGAKLQGERIETPDYIRRTPSVRVDYEHYVLNVIMKPVSQVLALNLEGLPQYSARAWGLRLASVLGKRKKGAKTDDDRRRAELVKAQAKLAKDLMALRKKMEREKPVRAVPDLKECVSAEARRCRAAALRDNKNRRARVRARTAREEELAKKKRAVDAKIRSMDRIAGEAILAGQAAPMAQLAPDKLRELREAMTRELVFVSIIDRVRGRSAFAGRGEAFASFRVVQKKK